MQNYFSIFSILLVTGIVSTFTFSHSSSNSTSDEASITWYTWEEAIELANNNPKKMFVDVYTDWCGWCKRMDNTTFTDPEIVKYINDNFYPVKFNAEQKEPIHYKGQELKFVHGGRRGYHELALALLDGRLSYPSIVYLNKNQDRISISPGYKDVSAMIKELKFIGEDIFKELTFEQYSKQ